MVSTSGLNRLAQVLAEWRRRLAGVRSALFFHPEHSEAWIWRIRQRVLDYLLKRYSGLDRDRPVPRADESGTIVYRPRGDGKQPRRADELSGVLTDLHGTNRARYDGLIPIATVVTPRSVEAKAFRDTVEAAIRICRIDPPELIQYESFAMEYPSQRDSIVLRHLAGLLYRCDDPKISLNDLRIELARLKEKYPEHFLSGR